ncbi:HNH endonuclease signature motif containing protein [Clostridium puniceum]|uniref:HNH endonuclease signature motif containing protein n=1 Tax=Clostridium puniceum TaxID=29367 RepID=UPI0011779E04|nr:HNH endonuclease signature motif containing protein [Clostridium puniceum]
MYIAQNGKCSVTGEILEIGNMECHHKKPKELGGKDEYKNLTFVKGCLQINSRCRNYRKIQRYIELR